MLHIEALHLRRGLPNDTGYEVCLPTLQLQAGEVVAISGPSGCGKSTLLEGLGLLLTPTRVDCYTLDNTLDIATALQHGDDDPLSELRARHIGFVLQSGGLLPSLTVHDNIMLSRTLLGLDPAHAPVWHAIRTLGLEGLLHRYPSALSIGERQRTAVVRAIAHGPSLLLADEPTSALDPENARVLLRLLIDLTQQGNTTALIVSHDRDLIKEFGLPSLTPRLSSGHSTFLPAGAT